MSSTPEQRSTLPDARRALAGERDMKYLPASFAQQRLWFLDRLMPGNAFYNEHALIPFAFPLDEAVFERCLAEIVLRHDALRTTFVSVEGQPVQVIARSASVPLEVVDLRRLPADARSAAVERLASEEVTRPFDLRRGPLLRTTLFRLDDADYLFLLTLHHIVSDGWSLGIIGRELAALYPAFATGRPSPLPPLTVQYGDYAVWQRRRLDGPTLAAHIDYWTKQLADAPTLSLPTDRPRPAVPSFRGAAHTMIYPHALLTAVRALAHAEDATLFMTLLAGYQLLLARYSGQDDIVVGVPVANRDRVELESVVGFFVNTLPMRTRLADPMTSRELVRRVRATAVEAFAHQELPFERLVEALHPQRDPSRNPIFQAAFQLFAGRGQAVAASPRPTAGVDATTAKFDLTLHLMECGEGLFARFEYSTDLFDPATIERLATHYGRLLGELAARPDAPVATLSLLDERERRRMLVDWNATATPYPRDSSLQSLFEAQAARTPDAPAVRFDGITATYAELNRRANVLAASLRSLGVGPDVPVALVLERSLDAVVAIVAIVKAGGAYVPIDPAYPTERIRLMLADAGAPVVLTQSRWVASLPASDAKVIALDASGGYTSNHGAPHDASTHDAGSAEERDVPSGAGPTNLAYIIYTSGSTGVPKGVAVEQRGVARLVLATNYVSIDAADRIAQISTLSFDAATFEIWGALLNGALLVGIPQDVALSAPALARALREERITTMFLAAALFRHVAAQMPNAFATLRALLVGGEQVDPVAAAAVLAHGRPQRLVNAYGPTETTTFAVCHGIEEVPSGAVTIPIGRPISNTRVYILDAHRQPVPVGVTGELYIGGDGVARGYWNDAAQTAERFLRDPFTDDPAARLYRTGDRALRRADGTIECLGRLDQQVKIRGFRVEPAEVESALRGLDGVSEALVIAREDRTGNRELVAYVASSDLGPTRGLELRRLVQAKLPQYLVPATVVCLPRLPLNVNGKIDRGSLPTPETAPAPAPAASPPATELERAISAVWQDVLGTDVAGVHDNFFEVGGHSLSMAQVHERLRTTLSRDISMIDLFRFPTIHALAQHLADLGSDDRVSDDRVLDDVAERAARQRLRARGPRGAKGDEAP